MSQRLFCRVCGHQCREVISGLFDQRFGAPGRYGFSRCEYCGLEQLRPWPDESRLKDLYETFYNWGAEQETFYNRVRAWFEKSPVYPLWLRWDGDICFHLPRGEGRLLDVGCNEGRGLKIYQRNGFQAEGLEINEKAAGVARKQGLTVHTVPMDQFSPEKPFDVVVLSNVLEHAPNPLCMIRQVKHLLAPEGRLWLSCPNAASSCRHLYGRHWSHWHVPFHLWQFSPTSLQMLLAQAGFQIVEMKTFTPTHWLASSLGNLLGGRPGSPNRIMRSIPMVAGLMLMAHLQILCGRAGKRSPNEGGAGDCLIVTASLAE